jgi:hypothetical protein
MSLKTIVNSADWEEVEAIIKDKLEELAFDFPAQSTQQLIALHTLANKKAHDMLTKWLKEMEFYKGSDRQQIKRDFQ